MKSCSNFRIKDHSNWIITWENNNDQIQKLEISALNAFIHQSVIGFIWFLAH
jgi:hypothetical protein